MRVERKIIRIVFDKPQTSKRELALQAEIYFGWHASYETLRNVLQIHKYSSRVDRKKFVLFAHDVEKSLRYANEYISLPPEYCDDLIFSDEMKILFYYPDGQQRV